MIPKRQSRNPFQPARAVQQRAPGVVVFLVKGIPQ